VGSGPASQGGAKMNANVLSFPLQGRMISVECAPVNPQVRTPRIVIYYLA
jgi:hypothetical protein